MSTDMATVKQTQQMIWGSGDYRVIGHQLMIMSELLCERVRVLPHHRVLDVATGTGNTALAAAHRNAQDVTGIDFSPGLTDIARERAKAEGLGTAFEVGDAEDLPCPDDSFDIVLSTLGVMFTPNQELAAQELHRVCRAGGRIGLTSWTPDGFVGQILKTVSFHAPPPQGVRSPALWGTEERMHELFGGCVDLDIEEQDFIFRFRSADHFVDTFATCYGPIVSALTRLQDKGGRRLKSELHNVAKSFGHPVEDSFEIPASYLEVVGTVR